MTENAMVLEIKNRKIIINPEGFSKSEILLVNELATKLFKKTLEIDSDALNRCTFFADPGYDALHIITANNPNWNDPRIEGCDNNPFNQHYWVAANLINESGSQAVIFDPIFGYVGLENSAKNPKNQIHPIYKDYYAKKRKVIPHTASWEGGVRIKTMGI